MRESWPARRSSLIQPIAGPRVSQHRFIVGQSVRLNRKFPPGAVGSYTVEQVMPLGSDGFEYRIKASEEKFVRVAKEHELDDDGSEMPPLS